MSQDKEIEAIFQVSAVLLKAFEEIHKITGDFINRNKQKKQDKTQDAPKTPQQQEKKSQEKKKEKSDRPKHPETEKSKPEESKPKPTEEKQSKKEQKKEKKERKAPHPDKPKYPLSGYFRFNQENLEKIKKEYPELAQKELVALSSIVWNKLSEAEKRPYEEAFEKDKKTYQVSLEKFYNNHPEERPKKPHGKSQ